MEPQEYTVKSFKPWMDRDDPEEVVRDTHGNYKGSITFEEYSSEPVDATFKTIPVPGDKKFGTIDPYTTKNGSSRQKFNRADRPDYAASSRPSQKPQGTSNWQPRDDMAIRAQFAIKAAIQYHGGADMSDIETAAVTFFKMVDRVKMSQLAEVKAPPQPAPVIREEPDGQNESDEPVSLDGIPF